VGSGTSLLRSALEKGWDAEIEGMTKSGLIQRLAAANPHLYARDIERIVDVVFEQIGSAWRTAIGSSYAASACSPAW
jgi:hypothetical protein